MPSENPEEFEELMSNPWQELIDILYNDERGGSLSQGISMFKRSVNSVRNFWSMDTWRIFGQLEENWNNAKRSPHHDHFTMISHIDDLNASMFAFLGMNRESARREQEWIILDLGRKVEQSLYIIRLLQNIFTKKQDMQTEHDLQESVLMATQSMVTYRYTYRDHLQFPLLMELMMLDMNYPKSLVYLIDKIKSYISAHT